MTRSEPLEESTPASTLDVVAFHHSSSGCDKARHIPDTEAVRMSDCAELKALGC